MGQTPIKSPSLANLKPAWKKGDPSPNPKGHPVGQRNFSTIYKEALKKIAESQNMTPEQIEELLVQSGIKNALKGNYKFYQDVLDRLHGKPKQDIGLGASDTHSPLKIKVVYE